jgi:hypothetical protein
VHLIFHFLTRAYHYLEHGLSQKTYEKVNKMPAEYHLPSSDCMETIGKLEEMEEEVFSELQVFNFTCSFSLGVYGYLHSLCSSLKY